MATFEKDLMADFNKELDRVKELYEKTQKPSTLELIKDAEQALEDNDSLYIYQTFIELEEEV